MKKELIISALLLAAGAAYAQNLNPVVEVTGVYAREATGIEKPSQLKALPDSVFKFNLDFDYSVKSTPYKGAYEFNPYLVTMRPGARLSGEQKLYLKAGAGYSLHPELDLVWNPVRTRNFRFNIYALHGSYIGSYRNIAKQDGVYAWDGSLKQGSGLNARTRAGMDLLYAFKGGELYADLQYRNVAATDFFLAADPSTVMHHKGQLRAGIRSNAAARFQYGLNTRVAYLMGPSDKEFHTVTDLSLGLRTGSRNAFRIDAGAESVSFGAGYALKFEAAPHYVLSGERFNMDLGAKFSFVTRSDAALYPFKSGFVFPDVHISFRIADAAVLQAAATGGDRLNSYDSLLERNPYLGSFLWHRDVTVERFNIMAGLRGSAAGRFSYDLRVGYQLVSNEFGWSYYNNGELSMAYVSPLSTIYGQLQLGWNSEHWDVSAFVKYGYTPMPTLETEVEKNVFAPASFRGNGHVFYKWGGRIKLGATLEGRSKLRSHTPVPGYLDLGAYAEYAFGRRLAFWLKGGNLLNQSIQRIPFVVEGGIYGTAGIRLVL